MGEKRTALMVSLAKVAKEFARGRERVQALRGVDLEVEAGSTVAIMGPSGGGKSTLLALIAGLDRPTSGSIRVDGRDVSGASSRQRTHLRRTTLGVILQTPSLLPMLTARENIELPLAIAGVSPGERCDRALTLLEEAGLADRSGALPEELSGGQQQRIAVMRALASNPAVLLADEPAGSLDSATGTMLLDFMFDRARKRSITVLMVTHDQSDAEHADRIIHIRDGEIESGSRS